LLKIVTLFWQANTKSHSFSAMYSEDWVEKLYRGFARNLTVPFVFLLYTDRHRDYREPIRQIIHPDLGAKGYSDCIRPYELGEPMILVGLDTIVTGNIDHLADYCLSADTIALPRDPYHPARACNGVALVPAGHANIAADHRGQNDMEWLRENPHVFIDDLFPGQVVSWKGSVEKNGAGDARIIYFHGERKPHQLRANPIIKRNWV
jgi:hypothetical protein